MVGQNDWFNIHEIEQDIFLIGEPGHVQSYLVKGTSHAALIDTGMGFSDIRSALSAFLDIPVVVFNTHWHYDHVGGNHLFKHIGIARAEQHLLTNRWRNEMLVPLYIRPCLDQGLRLPDHFVPEAYEVHSPPATFTVRDGQIFDLGGRVLEAISTPGHTHGSFSFLERRTRRLFCGDLIYRATLYAQFVDSDVDEYIRSLRKLLSYKDRIKYLHPGHCDPVVSPSFLVEVLHAFRGVKSGMRYGTGTEEWGGPVIRYEFGDFAILGKAEGARGVDLLEMLC